MLGAVRVVVVGVIAATTFGLEIRGLRKPTWGEAGHRARVVR
jgi:hypothetical protein